MQGRLTLRRKLVAQRKALSCWRGWHGVSRDGCGGDQVRFIVLPGNRLRPTSVSPDGLPPCSSGMTATGSHVYFYSLRGAQPQGEGLRLAVPAYGIRAHRGMPPPLQCLAGGAYRPSSVMGVAHATFLQGKALGALPNFPAPVSSAKPPDTQKIF